MLNAERFGESFECRDIDAFDGVSAQHAQGAGPRNLRLLRELVGRCPALRPHVFVEVPKDHSEAYGKRFPLTIRQRTLTMHL